MNSISIVITYYNNPSSLKEHLASFARLKECFDGDVELIIVDDGSRDKPAIHVLQGSQPISNLRLFRVAEDIPWNHRAARNIGAWEASHDWLLLLDIDALPLPDEFCLTLSKFYPLPRQFFMLPLRDPLTSQWMRAHHDTLLIERALYWEIGGYDENFSGFWGAGSFWLRRAEKVADKTVGSSLKFLEWLGNTPLDSQTPLTRKNSLLTRLRIRSIRIARFLGILTHKELTFKYVEIPDNQLFVKR